MIGKEVKLEELKEIQQVKKAKQANSNGLRERKLQQSLKEAEEKVQVMRK